MKPAERPASYARTLPACPECRGVGHFTLQANERPNRKLVDCPVCHGTGVATSAPKLQLVEAGRE
jgi:DnaJ-class molecular chaperone